METLKNTVEEEVTRLNAIEVKVNVSIDIEKEVIRAIKTTLNDQLLPGTQNIWGEFNKNLQDLGLLLMILNHY